MIIVDTNIIIYLHLNTSFTRVAEELFLKDPVWMAPLLWRSEFRNVLVSYRQKNLLSQSDILAFMNQAEKRMLGNEFGVNSTKVLMLASERGCSAYDCEFVALAHDLSFPLITQDKKILSAFPETATTMQSYLQQ